MQMQEEIQGEKSIFQATRFMTEKKELKDRGRHPDKKWIAITL